MKNNNWVLIKNFIKLDKSWLLKYYFESILWIIKIKKNIWISF